LRDLLQQFKVSTHGAFIAGKRGACQREKQLAKARGRETFAT
jgi:hypothetical protein